MNIFGIGGAELVLILLIMLIVAGPKRMIHWSYILGQYVAKFRVMWSETVDLIQKEFDEAGVDIQVPKEIPTRQSLNKQINKAMEPVTRPVKEALDEVDTVKKSVALKPESKVKSAADTSNTNGSSPAAITQKPAQDSPSSFGTWSGEQDEQN